MHRGTTVFDSHLRVSDRCSMNTQLPMSTSFLVTKRAVPPPPATKMLALSGSICLLVLARTTQLLLPRCCSLQSSQGYRSIAVTMGAWLAAKRLTRKAGALRAHMAAAAAQLDIVVG